ncbi:MAG: cupin domain-containing protein [Dermatophilaceae bacterium]
MTGRSRDDRPPVRRRVFTAEDVLRLLREGRRELLVGPDDRLTALARDTARERGVDIVVGPARPDPGRSPFPPVPYTASPPLVAPPPGGSPPGTPFPVASAPGASSRSVPAPGTEPRLTHVRDIGRLPLDPFPSDVGRPEMDVRLRDVVTGRDGVPMAAGLLSLRAGSFPWRLDYDEIEYVLEGELHITTATQRVVGFPGDVIVVPKGSEITFGTPSWAKFLYVTYPADWNPS